MYIIDINECDINGTHDCFNSEYCFNNNGSYNCTCPSGYNLIVQNGTIYEGTCTDVHVLLCYKL